MPAFSPLCRFRMRTKNRRCDSGFCLDRFSTGFPNKRRIPDLEILDVDFIVTENGNLESVQFGTILGTILLVLVDVFAFSARAFDSLYVRDHAFVPPGQKW